MANLSISFFESERDNDPKPASVSWADLCASLADSEERVSKEGGLCWSPATFNGTRANEHVSSLACLVLDCDGPITPEIASALEGASHVRYSTHTPGRWRIVLETSRPHTRAEHPKLWAAVTLALGVEIPGADACRDPARLFYAPCHRPGETPRCEIYPGSPIDVDAVLALTPPSSTLLPMPAPRASAPPPPENRPEIFGLEAVHEAAKRLRGEKRQLLEGLATMSWAPAKGERDTSLHKAMCLLATAPSTPVPQALVEELLAAVLDKMETEPEGRAHWHQKALYSWERARDGREKRDALTASIKARFKSAIETEPGATEEEGGWKSDLIIRIGQDGGAERVEALGHNIELILKHDERFRSLRWNELKREMEATAGPLAGVSANNIDTALANWLARSDYRMRVSRADCLANLFHVAMQRSYDPVKEYLEGVAWDGTARIEKVLRERCGASGNNPHLDRISRKFFIACAARGLNPGCQVDTMLILEGEGGVGKTSFVRVLGGDFAAEVRFDVTNKDGIMVMGGAWLVEMSELASMKRGDVEALRGFITNRVDKFRPPYSRVVEAWPRRSVFIGTTNEDDALQDPDGIRRFWPVSVGKIDLAWLEANRDQLWAEAVAAYKAGESWWLEGEEQEVANEEASLFSKVDVLEEIILQWWLKMAPDKRPQKVTTLQVMKDGLGLPTADCDRAAQMQVGRALRALGFVKDGRKRDDSGLRRYYFLAPEKLMSTMAVTETGAVLKVVEGQNPKEEEETA